MKKNKQNLRGFTLIETFVAISVLMIVVLGPMSLLSSALRDSRYIGDEITATYLAQEGVELMIDKRNNNISFTPEDYSCLLKLQNPGEGYNCKGLGSSGAVTFTRTIEIKTIGSIPNQREIISNVKIKRPGLPEKNVKAGTIIFVNQ